MMKSHSNVTANLCSGGSITYVVTFQVAAVLCAIAIIVSSALVLRHIYRKVRRSRADLLFIVLSISDIGVGSLSQTSLGILGMAFLCIKRNGTDSNSNATKFAHAAVFFLLFPYTFSYVVTTIVALDTLFVVTKQHSYKNFITKRRLMYILVFFFCYNYCSMQLVSRYNSRQSWHQRSLHHLHNIQYCFVYYNHWCIYLHFMFRL